jgi:cellulose synthase/poly-beta-1,6-N-acetylglucosamine synthase-like glycosyltransferase
VAVVAVAAFAIWDVWVWSDEIEHASSGLAALIGLRLAIEILASFYAFSLILKSVIYPLASRDVPEPAPEASTNLPHVGVIYLSAGDLDVDALRSLCSLTYPGPLEIVVHDDSGDPVVAAGVDRVVQALGHETGKRLTVLRRPSRTGGKPGAVNYVLSRIADRCPFLLLCDNDSIAIDLDAIQRALPHFSDPKVGAIQFRNVGVVGPTEGFVNRTLSSAIAVFDLFAVHQARHGLLPFLGHNGMLRTSAVLDAGCMTEGCFADDIDLSVRLALSGKVVRYARQVRFGERHPATYESFRRRAFKWAFGCGQVLRRHLGPVMRSSKLTAGQKLGFLEFTSFYAAQVALLAYLILAWIVFPFLVPAGTLPFVTSLAGSAFVVVSVFLPSLSYFATQRRLRSWWPFAWVCALVYGSVAFVTVHGVLSGLRDRPRQWVPTNSEPQRSRGFTALGLETCFGLALFLVPATCWHGVGLEPSLYLFVSVFLFAPLIAVSYVRARTPVPGPVLAGPPERRTSGSARTMFLIIAAAIGLGAFGSVGMAPLPRPDQASAAEIREGGFRVDGARFLVKGIHYSPWPPGTGPMKSYSWPDDALIESDLRKIRELGANTILVHDAPPRIVDQAAASGLQVFYTFFLNWQSIGDDALFARRSDDIAATAAELASRKNLLGVLLGNEIVKWVYDQRGREFLEGRLESLYHRVKQVAPNVAVSHANWPVTKGLDLSFMDFSAFNLYPSWPREVVVQGYGNYIQDTLLPIAGGKPLLISEFGQNALEANPDRQAAVLRESWEEIARRTAGGIVFEFADEWWKNYDNPIREGDWWEREYAPDDEKKHDLDPEEYYGIFTAERAPRPASIAVREMFQAGGSGPARTWFYVIPLLLIALYTVFVFRRKPQHEGGPSTDRRDPAARPGPDDEGAPAVSASFVDARVERG